MKETTRENVHCAQPLKQMHGAAELTPYELVRNKGEMLLNIPVSN